MFLDYLIEDLPEPLLVPLGERLRILLLLLGEVVLDVHVDLPPLDLWHRLPHRQLAVQLLEPEELD